MRMKRFLLAAHCALLAFSVAAQQRVKPGACELKSADCVATLPVFDFGRHTMSPETPPIHGINTVSVTCTRSNQSNGHTVEVRYTLKAEPAEPVRSMRSRNGGFLRYFLFLDPARTRNWGDGIQFGTFAIEDRMLLDDRNRSATRSYVIYGTVDGQQLVPPAPFLGAVVNRLQYELLCS